MSHERLPLNHGCKRSAPAVNRGEYIADGRNSVPGWFFRTDAMLFDAIDAAQRTAGITGDILEVGCYQGASAILLGYVQNPSERFIVCDIFDGVPIGPEGGAERDRFYMDLSRQSFESNYLKFHDTLPEIVAGPSESLADQGLGRSFRLIHIDGSHAYDIVRSDLLLAKRLLAPGGVVVFDDIVSMHTPGVTAAVWEGVIRDELIPLFQSRKLYGTWGTPLHVDIPEELPSYPHHVLGHTMLHVEDAVSDSTAPSEMVGDADLTQISDRERQLLCAKRRIVGAGRRVFSEIAKASRVQSSDERS